MFHKWLSSFKSKNDVVKEMPILTNKEIVHLQTKWTKDHPVSSFSNYEETIIEEITHKTSIENKNNVTRTKAYMDLYKHHPELHWAFLAHMVSRNAGWNMTDLKGSITDKLLSYTQTSVFFRFLEKANYLIFYDAYPQLLLYIKGKADGTTYTHLLPRFGVSRFMFPLWEMFIEAPQKHDIMLAISLIINEQQLLEVHVMQNAFFKKNIIQSLPFQLQDQLGFTHILFPYQQWNNIHLAGLTVQQFSSLSSRIEIGKQLYGQLFLNDSILNGVFLFADKNDHTGSREDYFPDIFSTKKNSSKIYSPHLTRVWPDLKHTDLDKIDWFKGSMDVEEFYSLPKDIKVNNMGTKHLLNMVKLSGLNELQQFLPVIERP